MIRIEMKRVTGEFGFEAKDAKGHVVHFDSSLENGGRDFGIRPMQGLLMSLGACSAIDVISILKKQRQVIDDFRIIIEGKREDGKIPSLWKEIDITFKVAGKLEQEKLEKACSLSVEKYCSVAETLRRAGAELRWKAEVMSAASSQ